MATLLAKLRPDSGKALLRAGDLGADGTVGGDEGLRMGDTAERAAAGAAAVAPEVGVRGVGERGD